ncbi:MAG: BofC C-terminal domain-containing protein [bacterium]
MRVFWERYHFSLLLGLFIIVTAGYIFLGGDESGLKEDLPEEIVAPQNSEEPTVFTVGSESRLIYQVTYNQCNHVEVLRERLPSEEIGLTIADLQAIYREWVIEQDGIDVLLTAVVDGLCEHCRSSLFVGIYEDKVAIYYGEPGGDSWLKEVTNISLDSLPPREQADLRQGVKVTNEEELPLILEGLMN